MEYHQAVPSGAWGKLAGPGSPHDASAALRSVAAQLGRHGAMTGRAMLFAGLSPVEQRLITEAVEALPALAGQATKLLGRVVHAVTLLVPLTAAALVYDGAIRYFGDRLIGLMLGSLAIAVLLPITRGEAVPQPRK
jgi:hypothetical protein